MIAVLNGEMRTQKRMADETEKLLANVYPTTAQTDVSPGSNVRSTLSS